MKKIIALLAVVFILLASGGGMAGEKLRIATEGAYPPFNYIGPDGKLAGSDVDIANALCEAMGAECELMAQDWDGMIPGLLAKKYDLIVASMSITEKRKKAVNFTKPYYQAPAQFVTLKGSGLSISKEGLKGKKIGVQRATTYANYLESVYADTVKIVYYDTVENHNLDLAAGRLDAVLAQAIYMGGVLKKPEGKNFEFVGQMIWDPKYIGVGAGIAVRKQDSELLKKVDEALAKIIADGTHKKIFQKYFDFDLYKY
jgi:lysine-arginine-ornithine-binding protein